MDTSLHKTPKLRLLRVFNLEATALVYCVQNAGRLFVVAWFACALEAASRVGLEWLLYSYPPKLPAALISSVFNPPTWLTPPVTAPWIAMAWAFVLRLMTDTDVHRGIVTARILRPLRLRFELSGAILLGAAVLAANNLVDGLSRTLEFKLFVSVFPFDTYQASDHTMVIWASISNIIRIVVMATVDAWMSVIAGYMLLHERFEIGHAWRIMHGNRLRLAAIFFLLSVAVMGLDRLVDPAKIRIVRSLTDPTSWTLTEAMLRYAVDFPLSILWTVVWAVTVGIVLDTLGSRYVGDRHDETGQRATPAA